MREIFVISTMKMIYFKIIIITQKKLTGSAAQLISQESCKSISTT